jgi:hypothetical protein
MKVIGLSGRPGATLSTQADIDICTPGGKLADRVQELHIKVIHILIESVERRLFPENYRWGRFSLPARARAGFTVAGKPARRSLRKSTSTRTRSGWCRRGAYSRWALCAGPQ